LTDGRVPDEVNSLGDFLFRHSSNFYHRR